MEKKTTVETIPELNIEIVERRKIRTPLHTNTSPLIFLALNKAS